MQSQRFLCKNFDNGPGDPPLRAAVELLASGVHVMALPVHFQEPLCKWLGAFRLVRTVERSVEGVHSIIGGILKAAPAARTAYISLQLRYPWLKPMIAELSLSPNVPKDLEFGKF